MTKIDVVVPTLMRKSLPYCLQAIKEVIPTGSIILITDSVKGNRKGELRNKGLERTSTEYVAFIDDDTIVNRDWFSKIMNYFESHPDVILVGGKYKHGYTIGCLVVKAEPFKQMGGFTESDVHLQQRYGSKSATLEDAICEHIADSARARRGRQLGESTSDIDVVVPTLMRNTLPYCLQAIFEVIPGPIVHLVTDKGLTTGEFRNKGLYECKSEFMVFVDDDVIVNKNWYVQCMKKLLENPQLIVVGGRFEHGLTLGCLICRTKAFQQAGGFPRMDCYIGKKLGDRIATVDVVCQHIHPKLDMVFRQFYNIACDFQTENKTGTGNNPKQAMKNFFLFLKWKQPEAAISQPLWIIKSVFCLPFLLGEKKKKNG